MNMISTQARETILIAIDPRVTAKAATIAAKAGNKTTANVIEEWLAENFTEERPLGPTAFEGLPPEAEDDLPV